MPKELQEVLSGTADDQLYRVTKDFLFSNICRKREEFSSYSKRMSKGQQLVVHIWCLIAEAANGGIQQWFFNSSGDHAAETIACLDRIGATKQAKSLREIQEKIFAGDVPRDTHARQDVLLKFDEIENEGKLTELEYEAAIARREEFWQPHDKLFGWCEEIENLTNRFIRNHPDEFVTDLSNQPHSWWRRLFK